MNISGYIRNDWENKEKLRRECIFFSVLLFRSMTRSLSVAAAASANVEEMASPPLLSFIAFRFVHTWADMDVWLFFFKRKPKWAAEIFDLKKYILADDVLFQIVIVEQAAWHKHISTDFRVWNRWQRRDALISSSSSSFSSCFLSIRLWETGGDVGSRRKRKGTKSEKGEKWENDGENIIFAPHLTLKVPKVSLAPQHNFPKANVRKSIHEHECCDASNRSFSQSCSSNLPWRKEGKGRERRHFGSWEEELCIQAVKTPTLSPSEKLLLPSFFSFSQRLFSVDFGNDLLPSSFSSSLSLRRPSC